MQDISRSMPTQYANAAANGDRVFVTWTTGNTRGGIGYAISRDGGHNFPELGNFLGGAATDFRPDVAISPDSPAFAYITYAQVNPAGDVRGVRLTRYSFADRLWRVTSVTDDSQQCNSPCVAVTPDGVIHVFYTIRSGNSGMLYYRLSSDGGQTFSDGPGWTAQGTPQTLTQGCQAVVDAAGSIHVVWVEKGVRVSHAQNTSSGWRYTVLAEGVSYWANLATSSNGVGVVWQERGTGGETMYRRFDGTNWLPPVNVSNTTTNSFYPALAYDQDQPVIVWSEVVNSASDFQIWVSRNLSPGQPLTTGSGRHAWPWLVVTSVGLLVLWQGEEGGQAFRIYGELLPASHPPPHHDPCAEGYPDVAPSYTFYNDIKYLTCRGVVEPDTAGNFRPSEATSRADLATWAVSAYNLPPAPAGRWTFSDVPASHPAYAEIEAAAQAGVINGYGDGTFRPDAGITRAQAAKIIASAAHYTLISPALPSFADVAPDSVFYRYIETLLAETVISLAPNFRPNDNIRRGEMCKLLRRSIGGVS